MSVHVSSAVWKLDLPTTPKLVLLKLADCADDAGRNSFPGVERLARECGLSKRSVIRVLDSLKKLGLIAVEKKAAQHRTTVYRVYPSRGVILSPLSEVPSDAVQPPPEVTPVTPRGDKRRMPEVTSATPRGDTHDTPSVLSSVKENRPRSVAAAAVQRAPKREKVITDLYRETLGGEPPGPLMHELADYGERFDDGQLRAAFREAKANKARTWKYVRRILDRTAAQQPAKTDYFAGKYGARLKAMNG